MSVVLLKNQLANARLQVRIAWGANLSADPATWSWTDVTADVVQASGGGVSITVGRANEATTAQPATCALRLKNQTGNYTPASPTAANYPFIRLGTPVQVRVSLDGGSTWTIRFQGEAASWAPGWDAQGRFAFVALAASGITRRLGQGSKPVNSALYRALTGVGVTNPSAVPFAYWSLEDGTSANQGLSPSAGIPPLATVISPVDFGAILGAAGSDVQPDFSKQGALESIGIPAPAANPTYFRAQVLVNVGPFGEDNDAAMGAFTLVDSLGRFYDANIHNALDHGIESTVTTVAGSFAYHNFTNVTCDDGAWHEIRMELTQSGGNATYQLSLDGAVIDSTTITSFTMAPIASVVLEAQPGKISSGPPTIVLNIPGSVGHMALWYASFVAADLDTLAAMRGYAAETATARLTRLCAEQHISLTVTGASDRAMGAQSVDTILNLLRACEAADLGYLFDGLGPGLSYVARSWLYNEPVSMTIDANSGQVPATPGPQPALDDQRLKNRVTVTRTNGSTVTVEDTNGPLGTAALGVFDNRIVVNTATDEPLANIASWVVHLGTVEGMRYAQIPLDLAAAPELASAWLATTPTERIDVTNLSNRLTQHPAGTVSLIAEGWAEFLSATAWRVVLNCSAFRPWEVFTIQDSRLGRIETDGSAMVGAETSTDTAFEIYSSGGPWDATATPFGADITGEQVTVTTITDWLNNNPFFNGTVFAWSAQGGTFAPSSVQFHEGSGSGLLTPNGIAATVEADAQSVAIMPNQPYGASVWVFCAVARNVGLTINWFTSGGSYISTAATTTVAVAANTWTQITFSPTTSPGTAGQASPIVLMTGTPPAGNLLYIDEAKLTSPVQQQFTVTRSVNGVVKAHSSGDAVKLWKPGVIAL